MVVTLPSAAAGGGGGGGGGGGKGGDGSSASPRQKARTNDVLHNYNKQFMLAVFKRFHVFMNEFSPGSACAVLAVSPTTTRTAVLKLVFDCLKQNSANTTILH